MAFLSRSPPSTCTGVSHQFSLKEHFMSKRSSTSSEGARNGRLGVGSSTTRISCDSSGARGSSSSAGGEHHRDHHHQRGDEMKTDAIKEERAQQQRGLGSVDEDQLLEEHKREMMRNSYVDAPFSRANEFDGGDDRRDDVETGGSVVAE
ncbi:unnamed protein product [Bathycoccus prasinos]